MTTPPSPSGPDAVTLPSGQHSIHELLGVEVVEAGPERVVMRLPVDWRVHQPYGILHGGVSALLAESAASFGAALAAGPGRSVVGIELNASHLRRLRDGHLTAEATPIRVGRTVQVWRIVLTDDDGRAICESRCTLAVLGAPGGATGAVIQAGARRIGTRSAPAYYVGVTPVGSRAPRPSLGLILPPTTQGELIANDGSTISTTDHASELAEVCRRAEATGADSLWAVDHLYWPHPIGRTDDHTDGGGRWRPPGRCSGPASSAARSAGHRAVAKQANALQLLSGGRFVLGVGVGIHEGEYQRADVDYHRRGRLMDEGVAKVRQAWADDGTSDYVMKPAAAPVPIWLGGSSDAARRRAAATGDGWIPLFLTPDEYATALVSLRRETDEAGRDPDAVTAGVVVFACVGDDNAAVRGADWLSDMYRLPPKAFARHLAAGSPDVCAERLHLYADAARATSW